MPEGKLVQVKVIGSKTENILQRSAQVSRIRWCARRFFEETQNFFTLTISEELLKLNEERSPETEKLINDAMKQMEILEKEYESLKIDLTESGDDKRVIYAMISNFQNRIELLQNVLEKIEEVKQLKQNENENSTTI